MAKLFIRVGVVVNIDPAKIDDDEAVLQAIRNGQIEGDVYAPELMFPEDCEIPYTGELEWSIDAPVSDIASYSAEQLRAELLKRGYKTEATQNSTCPECGCSDFDCDRFQSDNGLAWQEVGCENCGARWNETYVYTGLEIIESGNTK